MSSFPNSPKLLKGGIVLIDPETSAVQRVIALQYNPDTLSRSLQIQASGEGGDRSEALRLNGPPVETIKVEAEIDATDQLDLGDATANEVGIHPQLAALETIVYPSSGQLQANNSLAQVGTLEIVPDGDTAHVVCLEQDASRSGASHRLFASRRKRSTRR